MATHETPFEDLDLDEETEETMRDMERLLELSKKKQEYEKIAELQGDLVTLKRIGPEIKQIQNQIVDILVTRTGADGPLK